MDKPKVVSQKAIDWYNRYYGSPEYWSDDRAEMVHRAFDAGYAAGLADRDAPTKHPWKAEYWRTEFDRQTQVVLWVTGIIQGLTGEGAVGLENIKSKAHLTPEGIESWKDMARSGFGETVNTEELADALAALL